MKVLLAGATGALGTPTTRELIKNGHKVFGLTRSADKGDRIRSLGATPVIGDVLDAGAMLRCVGEVGPQAVVQLLNALPKRGPIRPSDLDATNELRNKGTKNLLAAATKQGVSRYLVESMIFGYGYGNRGPDPLTEDAPFGEPIANKEMIPALHALKNMESMVFEATDRGEIEGIVLRLGLFYGPGVGSTEFMIKMLRRRLMFLPGGGAGQLSWINVDDGATAIAAALDHASPGSVYNVVDDEPASFRAMTEEQAQALDLPKPKSVPVGIAKIVSSYAAMMANTNLIASNAKIKRELGWSPHYPSFRAGIAALAATRKTAS